MSCEGCFAEQKAIDQALVTARIKAKEFAIAKQKDVIVYFDEFKQPQFMIAEVAAECGIQATGGYFSKYQPVHE